MASSCSMVATTVISGLLLSIVPFLALDDADELAGMIFGTAGVNDRYVRRRRGVLHRAAQTVFDLAVAASCAHRNPFSQNVWRCGDHNHHHVGIGAAHCANYGARYVGDDGSSGADFIVNRARQRVAMAVSFPMHGILATRQRLLKGAGADLFVLLRCRRFACNHAARKHDVAIVSTGCLGKAEQRILAGAAWADHQHQPARPDRGGLIYCCGCQRLRHATRRPSRHTLRTTGMPRATCTRIKSARLPAAISPRSARPTASAGVLVTVRTAAARSIAGMCCGNCSAAIKRLEGM